MKRIYHPTYHSLAKQLDAEELFVLGYTNQCEVATSTSDRGFVQSFFKSYALPFFISFLAFISGSIYWHLYFSRTPPSLQPPPTVKIEEIKENVRVKDTTDLEHDVTLMKDLLKNLVITVERLSQQNQSIHKSQITLDTEYKSAPFKITATKANLREHPSTDSNSITTVLKDTVLMGIGFLNGWIKTLTPTGKEAWVHASMTSKIESGG